MKYIKHILSETIYLLPYFLMAVSFLSLVFEKLHLKFDLNLWCNLGGYSLFTSIMFVYVITMNRKYCFTNRMLPVSMCFISIFNMVMSFFPEYYDVYSQLFEIIVFSLTLFVGLILCITKRINR